MQVVPPPEQLREFSLEELRPYDGSTETPDGHAAPPIYVGVKGKVQWFRYRYTRPSSTTVMVVVLLLAAASEQAFVWSTRQRECSLCDPTLCWHLFDVRSRAWFSLFICFFRCPCARRCLLKPSSTRRCTTCRTEERPCMAPGSRTTFSLGETRPSPWRRLARSCGSRLDYLNVPLL